MSDTTTQEPVETKVAKSFAEEAKSSVVTAIALAGPPLIAAIVFAVWIALTGRSGPWVALGGIGAFVLVFALIFLAQRIVMPRSVVRIIRVGAVVLVAASVIAGVNWLTDVAKELPGLRNDSATLKTVVRENPDHANLVGELSNARGEVAKLTRELSDTKIELSELKSQLSTTINALAASQSQLSTSQSLVTASQSQVADLQQQLARAQQPPAVVLRGGQGGVVNQSKMNKLSEKIDAGRKLQLAAPRRDADESSLKPWADSVDRWYQEIIALVKAECTPQALVILRDTAGMMKMEYERLHQNERIQNTMNGLNRRLSNAVGILQKPELCP